jgi:hypothetical protein
MIIKQSFLVNVEDKVKYFLKKFDEKFKRRFSKKIIELEIQPIPKSKKHVLDIKNHRMLCEFGIDKIRFYYTIYRNKIIINDCEYLGNVNVEKVFKSHKAGSYGHYGRQQKDIKKMKKDFKKNK